MSAELEKILGPVLLAALDERMRQIAREEKGASAPESEEVGLDAKEAAPLLGVSRWRVYEMVRRGALRAYRPSPRTVRIPLSAIKEFKEMSDA